ncbi:MAG: hypothetical protein J6Q19_04890 [Bacteroidaceae bacterium]|nr:hypothetical protein [Bacteroidaceae bacterium]
MNVTSLLALGAAALMFLKNDNASGQDNEYSDPQGDAEKALQNALDTGKDLGEDGMNLDGEEDGYYNKNVEKSDLKVYGLLRLGNMLGSLNRCSLTVFVTNDSKSTTYFIKSIAADAYVLGEKIGIKKDYKVDCNVSLKPGQTIDIHLPNSECYMASKTHREKVQDTIKSRAGKKTLTASKKTDLGAIAEIDVRLTWQPRSGAGEPQEAYYTEKPCDARYIDEAFLS